MTHARFFIKIVSTENAQVWRIGALINQGRSKLNFMNHCKLTWSRHWYSRRDCFQRCALILSSSPHTFWFQGCTHHLVTNPKFAQVIIRGLEIRTHDQLHDTIGVPTYLIYKRINKYKFWNGGMWHHQTEHQLGEANEPVNKDKSWFRKIVLKGRAEKLPTDTEILASLDETSHREMFCKYLTDNWAVSTGHLGIQDTAIC